MNQFNKAAQDAVQAMRGIGDILQKLAESVPMKADKPGDIKQKKKTQKGAIHKVNPVFLGRKILAVTPAQYRSRHIATAVPRTPNYKLPHPAPRWRNRWTSQ